MLHGLKLRSIFWRESSKQLNRCRIQQGGNWSMQEFRNIMRKVVGDLKERVKRSTRGKITDDVKCSIHLYPERRLTENPCWHSMSNKWWPPVKAILDHQSFFLPVDRWIFPKKVSTELRRFVENVFLTVTAILSILLNAEGYYSFTDNLLHRELWYR